MFLQRFLRLLLVPVLFMATLSTATLDAKEMTQDQRNEMAAKLIPIITMLLMDDTTHLDTQKPDKPRVSVPAPTEIEEDNVTITVVGEVGSFIYVNGVKVGTIGVDGSESITLDLKIGDNLFFLTLRDKAGNESDAVDFTINGAAVIHADRKIFIFPGDSERVIVDENVTLSFVGETLSWVTIDNNAIVVSPSSSEEPMQKKTVKVAISRDGNLTGETVSFDILVMKKVILLEGDLGVEGGTIYNQWKDISIHFDENVLEQDHHFELSIGLNTLGTMVFSSKTIPPLTEEERLGYNSSMPSFSVIYNNYVAEKSENIELTNSKLGVKNTSVKNRTNYSKKYAQVSSYTETVFYNSFSQLVKKYCVDLEPLRLEGFEFQYIWNGNIDLFEQKNISFAGHTRLRRIGDRELKKVSIECSSRLWGINNPNTISLSKDEEPVLLVHGFVSSGKLGAMDDKQVYFKNFAKVLKSTNRYVPFEFEWKTNARFQDVAKELKKAIELIGNKTKKQVHIVAHSFGGVLSRTLIQNEDNKEFSEKYIASLTTVGSPHSGIRDGGYTSSGLFSYYNNEDKSVKIGNSTSIDFPHGQNGFYGEKMGACGAISCYQMGIADNTFSADIGYLDYGTFKEYGFIPYKLASTIENYPNVPTQVLLGLNPSKIYLNTPEIGSGLYQMVYEFDTGNSLGDNLISLQGQRAYPLISAKYEENNIEEHILNFYLNYYSDFNNSGIGVYDDMLSIFNSFDDYEETTDLGKYDFTVSTFHNFFSRKIKLIDNNMFTVNENILNFYTRGATHRTSESKIIDIDSFKIRLNSEVGLNDCVTSSGCRNPTWQYFQQFAEKNKAKSIEDSKNISLTGDVKVVTSSQVSAKRFMRKSVLDSTNPKVIVEAYTADRDIFDFIMNLVETGERTVLKEDGTYELNVTYSPDTNYTVIAYVEGDENARFEEHIRAAQSIFLETRDTLEKSTLHFPTITLVDTNYEEGSLVVKVKDSETGNFLSDFNVSVVLNGIDTNIEDVNVSTGIEFNTTKAKGDYTVSVYKNEYIKGQAQCTILAGKTSECVLNINKSSITGRWITDYSTDISVNGALIRLINNNTYTQVQIYPNSSGCSVSYDRELVDIGNGKYRDEYYWYFYLQNDKLTVSFSLPNGNMGYEYSHPLTLSDAQISELCPDFIPQITHNGTTYGTVTSPYTGKVWLDRNLGASQVCTSSTDTACYGDSYQWGRNYDGHQDSTSTTTTTKATDVNDAGSSFITQSSAPYDWATVDSDGSIRSANWSKTDGTSVCPVGFRVPTLAELQAETLDNGVTNSTTAFSNFLKFPAAGIRDKFSGSLYDQGSSGFVWSTSVTDYVSYGVYFYDTGAGSFSYRIDGFTVRCLRD